MNICWERACSIDNLLTWERLMVEIFIYLSGAYSKGWWQTFGWRNGLPLRPSNNKLLRRLTLIKHWQWTFGWRSGLPPDWLESLWIRTTYLFGPRSLRDLTEIWYSTNPKTSPTQLTYFTFLSHLSTTSVWLTLPDLSHIPNVSHQILTV